MYCRRIFFINSRNFCREAGLVVAALFGVSGFFLINGDHFCLFQNTIWEPNSGVPVRMFGNQRLTKTENKF